MLIALVVLLFFLKWFSLFVLYLPDSLEIGAKRSPNTLDFLIICETENNHAGNEAPLRIFFRWRIYKVKMKTKITTRRLNRARLCEDIPHLERDGISSKILSRVGEGCMLDKESSNWPRSQKKQLSLGCISTT